MNTKEARRQLLTITAQLECLAELAQDDPEIPVFLELALRYLRGRLVSVSRAFEEDLRKGGLNDDVCGSARPRRGMRCG